MFELLCQYARKFGQDFPISKVMDTSNENGVVQLVQKCLAENKPYGDDGGGEKKKKATAKTSK